jgi:hypothetical protein
MMTDVDKLTAIADRFADAVQALRADLRDHFEKLRTDLRAQHSITRELAVLLKDFRSVIEAQRTELNLERRVEVLESRLGG